MVFTSRSVTQLHAKRKPNFGCPNEKQIPLLDNVLETTEHTEQGKIKSLRLKRLNRLLRRLEIGACFGEATLLSLIRVLLDARRRVRQHFLTISKRSDLIFFNFSVVARQYLSQPVFVLRGERGGHGGRKTEASTFFLQPS